MKKLLLIPLLLFTLGCSTDEMDQDSEIKNSLFEKFDNELWNIKELSEVDDSNCELGCITGWGFNNDKSMTYVNFYGGVDRCMILNLSNLNEEENKISVDATYGTNSFGKLTFTLENNVLTVTSVGGDVDFTYELIKENESLKSICN